MNSKIELASTVLIASCAVVLTVFSLSDRFREEARRPARNSASLRTVDQARLRAVDSVALRASESEHAVVLTEFLDVECPYCASFSRRLDSAAKLLGDTLAIRVANFPLSNHRFARSGAAAVECAFQFGKGAEFVRSVYMMQDSLGFWPWERFALSARIADTSRFGACRTSAFVQARVSLALATAERLELRGTPTIFLDRGQYDRPPTLDELVRDVRRLSSERR